MATESVIIHDHLLQDSALGELHVVSFRPSLVESQRQVIIANSLAGHIFTPDGFGLPYTLAQNGITAHYVEFPASGHSSWPEDKRMRKDYVKHGVVALGDPVAETLLRNQDVLQLSPTFGLAGFSIGAIRVATLLPSFDGRATDLISADSAGFGTNPTRHNLKRYRTHLADSKAEFKLTGENVDNYFVHLAKAYAEYQETHGESLKCRRHGKYSPVSGLELRAIFDSMNNLILGNIAKFMQRSTSSPELGLRAGFTSRTYALDRITVNQANSSLAGLEKAAQEKGGNLTIGIVQGLWFGEWHDQAIRPDRILRLIGEPVTSLSTRLQHIYMP